eukprot:6884096-Heterocapsa_arctica.AAC.1
MGRAIHYIFGKKYSLWILLDADDWLISGGGPCLHRSLLLLLLLWEVLRGARRVEQAARRRDDG